MGIDFLSFAGGFIAGGASTAAGWSVYKYRGRMKTGEDATKIQQVNRSVRRSAMRRYTEDLTKYIQQYHLPGSELDLNHVLIEPRVLADVEEYDFDLEDPAPVFQSSSRVIPRLHDFPEVYASYNLESIKLTDLLNGPPHLAVLGMPGTGKSTLLASLALMSLDLVSFQSVDDLDEELIKDLSKDQREKLFVEYQMLQDRAIMQLREMKLAEMKKAGNFSDEQLKDLKVELKTTQPKDFFPIFVNVADIEIDMNLFGTRVDPSEPIIHAYQQYASSISRQTVPVIMYRQLEQGRCLVMIDGFDELSTAEQARIYPWLKSFMENYGHNRIVITGSALGYDALLSIGFTPVYMHPVTEKETHQLIKNWIKAWSVKVGRLMSLDDVDEELVNRLLTDNRNRNILDLTMKIWAALAGEERELGRRGWYERYVRTHCTETEQTPAVLREIAKVMLDRGESLKTGQLAEVARTRSETDGKPIENADEFVKSLRESGMMVHRLGDVYDFRHPMILAYLAGESLIHDMGHRLEEVALLPSWQEALGFASVKLDMLPAVKAKLTSKPDVILSNLFDVVRWLPESDPNSQWRGEVLKRLSAALVAPSQFDGIRERAVGALVASRDPNVLFILRQGVRHTNPSVRKLACVGLGAIGSSDAIKDLRSMVVDEDTNVQLAAAQALGAIASEGALETMVQGLLEGEEGLRQAVAEALASIPGEGYDILNDAIEHNDMLVRRAAVYGLARVPTMKALGALYKTMMEDSQWYVRSAAESIFSYAKDPEQQGPKEVPTVDNLIWLRQWAARLGEGVPEGEGAHGLVVRALQQGSPEVKVLAAQALARLSYATSMKPLYAALGDKEEKVRAAAFMALNQLQLRSAKPLPGIA